MRLLTAGSLVRVQLGEPKKADTLMRIGFSFAILLTRTNDKLLQICLQIWQKQSGGLFRSRLRNLEVQPKWYTALCAPFLLFFLNWTRTTTSCSKFALLQIWKKQSGEHGGGRLPPLRGHFCIRSTVGADSIRPLYSLAM